MRLLFSLLGFWLLINCVQAAPEVSSERQQALQTLLYQDCGSCHGLTLAGGLGPSLAADQLRGKSDQWLIDTILQGRPDTAMPPWADFMSEAEAAWLLRYLRTREGEDR